jgi:uncharacterized membrane protein
MTDPAPPSPPPAARTGRGLRWLLVASLALNLLFLGLAAGGAARIWRMAPAADSTPAAELQLLWRAMPEDDRRAMRRGDDDDWRERRGDRSEGRAERAADLLALRSLLLADPFDRAALEARLVQARDLQAQRADRALARMLDRIEGMSVADRARMVQRMERRLSRRDGRDDRD